MAISLGRLRLNPPDPLLLRIGCSDHSHVGSRPLFLERAAALAGRSEVRDANGESGSTLSSVLDGVPFLRVETLCFGTGDGVPVACARKWAFLPVGKARCLERVRVESKKLCFLAASARLLGRPGTSYPGCLRSAAHMDTDQANTPDPRVLRIRIARAASEPRHYAMSQSHRACRQSVIPDSIYALVRLRWARGL